MNIHEYQAKQVLAEQGLPVPVGKIATTAAEAEKIFIELGAPACAIKSQIHAGGRGKGKLYDAQNRLALEGGVHLAHSAAEAKTFAEKMLGNFLVTRQTGPAGRQVRKVYLYAACNIAHEFYVSILIDRTAALPVLVASTAGGMEIEEVAAKTPEKILRLHFDPAAGLWPYQARQVAYFLGLNGAAFTCGVKFFLNLAKVFCALDCSLLEINPLVLTPEDQLIALDAKMVLDDNSLFRHTEFQALHDPTEDDPGELEARQHDLSYIALDGEIGCLVNGAGLAMATMDAVKLYGRQPANFLDVGGGANKEKVAAAFKIILNDPKVKAILVNIFGGIMRCDVIAAGVISAAEQVRLKVPLVVRLEGANSAEGKRLLAQSGLAIKSANSLDEAAKQAAALVAF